MFSLSNHRWLIVSAGHYVTLFLISQLNYYLAVVSINVIISGMIISYSALVLNYSQGLLSLIPIAFYIDSKSPLPFGSTLAIMVALHSLVVGLRYKFRRESASLSVLVSLLNTIFIYLAYTFFAAASSFAQGANYLHALLNLIASSLVIVLVNKPFFALQTEALAFFGIRILEEQIEAR